MAGKELFGLGPHEKQFAHPHWISTLGAFSVGYSHLVPRLPIALGADITLYHIPTDLESYYDPSRRIPRVRALASADRACADTRALTNGLAD